MDDAEKEWRASYNTRTYIGVAFLVIGIVLCIFGYIIDYANSSVCNPNAGICSTPGYGLSVFGGFVIFIAIAILLFRTHTYGVNVKNQHPQHWQQQPQQQQQVIVVVPPATIARAQVSVTPTETKFCSACGQPMSAQAKFCEHCGAERGTA